VPLLKINYGKKKLIINAALGVTVMEALLSEGVPIAGACGGLGTCGKCRVRLSGEASALSPVEKEYLKADELAQGWRLACYTRLVKDCELELANESENSNSLTYTPDAPAKYLAVDLGSTTIVIGLIDGNGRLLNQLQVDNPQRLYGSDVLSRLSFALKSETNRALLRRLVINAINRLLDMIDTTRLQAISLVGNPAMVHLLMGADVSGLAAFPYRSTITGAIQLTASDLELGVPDNTPVYIPPAAGLYVGSDALAGAASLWPQDNFMLIDLGTNAEMVVRAAGQWLAVSAAAGPAFEGANIYQGMRALPGAITGCHYDHGQLRLQVIGDEVPRGICGAGLIQIIAELKRLQAIDADGVISTEPLVALTIRQGKQGREVLLYEDEHHSVVLTQEDVRQFQLAKAAVRVAGDTLIAQLPGVDWETIYLAGAMGSNLAINDLLLLGVLPVLPHVPVVAAGNTALQGAARAAFSPDFRARVKAIAAEIEVIELANQPGFQQAYLRQLSLIPSE